MISFPICQLAWLALCQYSGSLFEISISKIKIICQLIRPLRKRTATPEKKKLLWWWWLGLWYVLWLEITAQLCWKKKKKTICEHNAWSSITFIISRCLWTADVYFTSKIMKSQLSIQKSVFCEINWIKNITMKIMLWYRKEMTPTWQWLHPDGLYHRLPQVLPKLPGRVYQQCRCWDHLTQGLCYSIWRRLLDGLYLLHSGSISSPIGGEGWHLWELLGCRIAHQSTKKNCGHSNQSIILAIKFKSSILPMRIYVRALLHHVNAINSYLEHTTECCT